LILLNRYLLGQFIRNFLTVAVAFIAIYLLIDFFDKIDHFTKAGKSISEALAFFCLNVPFILDQLGPVLILLSGVITLGILNHNHELSALKASGIPLKAIIRPILFASISATVLYLVMAQWILPWTISASNRIWYQDVEGKVPLGAHRNGRYYYKGSEGFYSFEWSDPGQYIFRNFSYSAWDKDYHLGTLITCERAEYDQATWQLKKGQIQKRTENKYEIRIFEDEQFKLPESPEIFFVPEYKSAEMSVTDLYRDISRKDTPGEKAKAWAEFLGRLSYVLLGLPLILLGLPILILSYQKWGRDLSVAIPASCGMAFIAWGLWGALQSLARADYISPLFAATIVHFIFAAAGLFLLYKQDN
jgi:lipopolysaccharide export system permease protein